MRMGRKFKCTSVLFAFRCLLTHMNARNVNSSHVKNARSSGMPSIRTVRAAGRQRNTRNSIEICNIYLTIHNYAVKIKVATKECSIQI